MTARHRAALAILLVALIAVIAACGIPKDSAPRLIAEEPEGFNTTQPTTAGGGQTIDVFLVDGRAEQPKLAAVERATTQKPGPLEAVQALLAGVTEQDDTDGYQTKIPSDTELRDDSTVKGDTVTIDLSSEISTISAQNAVQAFAQLVYTATQYQPSGPSEVQFMIEGKPIKAQTETETKPMVTRDDYPSLDPQS